MHYLIRIVKPIEHLFMLCFAVFVYYLVFFVFAQQHTLYTMRISLRMKLRGKKVRRKADSHHGTRQINVGALFLKRQYFHTQVIYALRAGIDPLPAARINGV